MSIKKYQEDFQIINEIYYLYIMDDEVKEESLEFQEQEKLYNDVEDKTWKKEVEEDSMSAKVTKKELQAQLVSQPT